MPIPVIIAGAAKVALGNGVKSAIVSAVQSVAKDKAVPEITPKDAPPVAGAILAELAQNPAFINATNSERWYQSGVAWGLNGVTAGAFALVMPQVFQHGYHLDRWDWPVAGPSVFILLSAAFGYIRRFVPGLKPLFSRKG